MNMRCKLYLAVIRMCALNFGCNIEEFLRSTDLSLFYEHSLSWLICSGIKVLFIL